MTKPKKNNELRNIKRSVKLMTKQLNDSENPLPKKIKINE